MPYTLTITCDDLSAFVELARLIDSNGLNSVAFNEEVAARTAPKTKAKATKKADPVETPVAEDSAPPAEAEVTYDAVKSAVLNVAKKLGREASLDLLSEFGVVSGTGNDRKGNISELKPEQYAAVVEAANAKVA